MSWTPHLTHNLTQGSYVTVKNTGFPAVLTSAHLAGTDGAEWGHHGDDNHKPTQKEASDLRKACNSKNGCYLNGQKFMYISGNADEGDTNFGFKCGPLSAGVWLGKTYTAIIIANDRIAPCNEAVGCFAEYLKSLSVE